MKRSTAVLLCSALLAPALSWAAPAAKSAAELEKEKALSSPYANDLGPDSLAPEALKAYPADAQAGYALLKAKCTVCHTASRPLNSQFVETAGKDDAAREAGVGALKKSDPDVFASANTWQVEGGIWKRYVKRMMSKPGCNISPEDGKKIWAFLAHDSRERKLGKSKAKWKAHREKLLADFKAKHAARYEELYAKSKGGGEKPAPKK